MKIKKETDDAVKEKIDEINLAVSQKVEEVKRTIKAKLEETDRIAKAKIDTANVAAARKKEQAEFLILSANENAEKIIAAAKQKAEEIAGDAYLSLNKMKELNATKQALKNIIEGYGDEYIIPTYSLLDELADEVGYTEAGQELKAARSATRLMVKEGKAATCEYVEAKRKETAIRFVVDAFNSKVDSILSRGRADNHGKLAQEIKDAYSLVNHNGSAFRNAKITDEYLAARLEELKWAATAHALKEKEREEQRQIREQIREEEKARKEFERALKEAEKEEDAIKKAMGNGENSAESCRGHRAATS